MVNSYFFNIKKESLTLKEVLDITKARLAGKDQKVDPDTQVKGITTLQNADYNQLSFLSSAKYLESFKKSKAGFCLIEEKYLPQLPETTIGLIHSNPYFAYSQITAEFYGYKEKVDNNLISPKASIEESASIGSNCKIMPGVYIGKNVKIGDNCYIGANSVITDNCQIGSNSIIHCSVVLSYCQIGNNAIIHNGAKIGQDGFGFAHNKGVNHKILQLGLVIIGNDVEIGANSCIDRGAIEDTIIDDGVKIDNLVQIGHGVKIGQGTVLCGCSAIAGSARIGKFVQIGGGALINGHITIGDGAKIAGGSGVAKSVAPMQSVGGSPAMPIKDWHRINIKLAQIIKKSL